MILPWREVPIDGGWAIPTSLTDAEQAKLRELSKWQPVLEVGTAYGFSTVAMAKQARQVVAVDPHNAWPQPGHEVWGESLPALQANLRGYDVAERVAVIVGRSEHVMPGLLELGVQFGLVFIDGDHSYRAVRSDLVLGQALLRPGGVLAVHDYDEDSCPDVRKAVEELFPAARGRLVDTLWWKTR